MKVFILHNPVSESATPDDRDVLIQADAVQAALHLLGHETDRAGVSADPDETIGRIRSFGTDLVFNLVESLDGDDSAAHCIASAYEQEGFRYTGATARAIEWLKYKNRAKEILWEEGLPTPRWWCPESYPPHPNATKPRFPGRFIVKSAVNHASKGIDDGAIVTASNPSELRGVLRARKSMPSDVMMAEEYIEGREFNLSLLGPASADGDPEVLPPAEIVFEAFPAEKPRIVGYAAKWDESSFEYSNTPRRFDFPDSDAALLSELGQLALDCWKCFVLCGYARVDFRVDDAGTPWVIDINFNPCLSPDAGFAAALDRAGIPFHEAIRRILSQALRDAEDAW